MSVLLHMMSAAGGSAAPEVNYRYWEILMYTPALNDTGFDFEEVEFRISGTDQTGSGTASASDTFESLVPAQAFDNDFNTRWASLFDGMYPKWLRYDFGPGQGLIPDTLAIQVAFNNDRAPVNFDIRCSNDAENWTLTDEYRDQTTGWSTSSFKTFSITNPDI